MFDDSRYRKLDDPQMAVQRAAYVLFYAADGLAVDELLSKVDVTRPDLTATDGARSRCVIL